MSGPKFPPDSPSPPFSPPPPSPEPSKQEQDAAKIAKEKLPSSPKNSELSPLDAKRVSEGSFPPKILRPPLMSKTPIHKALEIYDTIKIPPNTTFVLSCYVFCFASTIFSGRRQLSLPVSPSLRRAVAFF